MYTVISPSQNPVAYPEGDGGSGELITTLTLFDPTFDPQVKGPTAVH